MKKKFKSEIVTTKNKEVRVKVKGGNNKTIATTETYKNKDHARKIAIQLTGTKPKDKTKKKKRV